MVATWKIKAAEELGKRMADSQTVGLVKISKIPSSQFQQMRKSLKGDVEIRVTKCSILRRACEKAEIEGLDAHINGQVGVILADMDAFKLAKLMKTTKTEAPAKGGSISEKDITIPAGDTPFRAGPIIGDLQKVGIKAKIQGGKIIVTDDSPVVKQGEVISSDLATVLTRLGIKPVEIGLTINTAYEAGLIYAEDVLNIDEETTLANLQNAYMSSLNLAYNASIYNKETIKLFLVKAFTESMALAVDQGIVNKETVKTLLAKANMQVLSLNSLITGEPLPQAAGASEQATEEVKEEPKEEETDSEEEAASGLASLFG